MNDQEKLTLAREALELARNNHGVMLMSDPPQDAWKARGVDAAIQRALAAIATESAPATKRVSEEWLEAWAERAASAPAAGAASIDTPEFQNLMGDLIDGLSEGAVQGISAPYDIVRAKLIAHINAWGAQQREEGWQELQAEADSRLALANEWIAAAQQARERVTELEAALAQRAADAAIPDLSDDAIVVALHAQGIDTYPSKYGFAELQVSATNLPQIRRVMERLLMVQKQKLAAQVGDGDERGWCLERGPSSSPAYLFVDSGVFAWTQDHMKALRLSRRDDAEQIALIVEDADRIAEHMWMARAALTQQKGN